MKTIKTILIAAFILFMTYWILFVLPTNSKVAVETYQKIDSLSHSIDSLEVENKKLDSTIVNYTHHIDAIDNSIGRIKNEKTIIKEIYHETIINVDNYNSNQLDSFFTNRYYPSK